MNIGSWGRAYLLLWRCEAETWTKNRFPHSIRWLFPGLHRLCWTCNYASTPLRVASNHFQRALRWVEESSEMTHIKYLRATYWSWIICGEFIFPSKNFSNAVIATPVGFILALKVSKSASSSGFLDSSWHCWTPSNMIRMSVTSFKLISKLADSRHKSSTLLRYWIRVDSTQTYWASSMMIIELAKLTLRVFRIPGSIM